MATKARIEANRRNAQRSTGPKTVEGKAKVSQNAVTHGLTARNHVVLDGEDTDEFAALRAEWLADLQPVGSRETSAFDRALAAEWALRRGRQHEAAVLARNGHQAAENADMDQVVAAAQLLRGLAQAPVETVLELERNLSGTQWLIEAWENLRYHAEECREWFSCHLELALQLEHLEPHDLVRSPLARPLILAATRLAVGDGVAADCRENQIRIYNVMKRLCGPLLGPEADGLPERTLALGSLTLDLPATVAEAQEYLVDHIEKAIAELKACQETLFERRERDRQLAVLEASLLDLGPSAALRLRYMTAHDRSLRQALSDLEKLQKERRSAEAEDAEAKRSSPVEGVGPVPPRATAEPPSSPAQGEGGSLDLLPPREGEGAAPRRMRPKNRRRRPHRACGHPLPTGEGQMAPHPACGHPLPPGEGRNAALRSKATTGRSYSEKADRVKTCVVVEQSPDQRGTTPVAARAHLAPPSSPLLLLVPPA